MIMFVTIKTGGIATHINHRGITNKKQKKVFFFKNSFDIAKMMFILIVVLSMNLKKMQKFDFF